MYSVYNSIFCVLRYFLSTNMFYDELLAINIAGQTYLWEVLHHLATQRSLYSQMLDILMKTVQMFGINDVCPKSCNVYIHTYVHTYIHTYVHIYIYIYMHKYDCVHVFHKQIPSEYH